MYIFDRVIGRVTSQEPSYVPLCMSGDSVPLRCEFDFYQGTEKKPFREAKTVADASFLSDRVAELSELHKAGKVGTVELTSATSKIRGYQGGLVHIIHNNGRPYLVAPLRGADAPSSPLMLDIQAGRLTLDNEEEQRDGWRASLFRKGFEVGYFTPAARLIPQVGLGNEVLENQRLPASLQNAIKTSYATALPEVTAPFLSSEVNLVSPNDIYLAKVRVYKQSSPDPETFYAGWAALPSLSSIEFFEYVTMTIQGDLQYTDLNIDKGKPVHRDIYVIDLQTARTQVWNAGACRRTARLWTLLQENKKKLEGMKEAGTLRDGIVATVSPKLRAAVEQLPYFLTKRYDPLELSSCAYL